MGALTFFFEHPLFDFSVISDIMSTGRTFVPETTRPSSRVRELEKANGMWTVPFGIALAIIITLIAYIMGFRIVPPGGDPGYYQQPPANSTYMTAPPAAPQVSRPRVVCPRNAANDCNQGGRLLYCWRAPNGQIMVHCG